MNVVLAMVGVNKPVTILLEAIIVCVVLDLL